MVGASGGSFSSAYGPPRLTYPAPAACSGDTPVLDALGAGALFPPPLLDAYAASEADVLPFALDVADCPAQPQLQHHQQLVFPSATQQQQPLSQHHQLPQAPLLPALPKHPLVAGPPSPSGPHVTLGHARLGCGATVKQACIGLGRSKYLVPGVCLNPPPTCLAVSSAVGLSNMESQLSW